MARPPSSQQVIGANIRAVRQRRRLSLRELAPLVGLSHQGVHRIERGEVETPYSRVETFARALNVPVSALLPDDPRPA